MTFKNFDMMDIGFTKLSVLFFTLFAISAWPGLAEWVVNTPWMLFLVISLVLAVKPVMKSFKM